jgi:hypothetical protein
MIVHPQRTIVSLFERFLRDPAGTNFTSPFSRPMAVLVLLITSARWSVLDCSIVGAFRCEKQIEA